MPDFSRNNLAKATSPYLRQHEGNPIWWQEWNTQTLGHAKKSGKPLFVSIGYSTCHWCHVMASEAFSDREIADYLNGNFVCIKVDREQRPDIDQFAMSFLVKMQGSGGWPLNIFLTPDLKPFLALTYAGVAPRHGMPAFIDILKSAKQAFSQEGKIPAHTVARNEPRAREEAEVIGEILSSFDVDNGGFGGAPKFPPHCTLLLLASEYEATKDHGVKAAFAKTLDSVSLRGMHDHLQGGFYRYCTDAEWTIPHFEKMLYDQAMLLWAYSAAYKALSEENHKIVCEKIIKCLEETFRGESGLYFSAHDADTEHEEGSTYIWAVPELRQILTQKEFGEFEAVYDVTEHGNFEGKNHLVKKGNVFLPKIEEKLLAARSKRAQPFVDRKIVTEWNCLAGIGLVTNYRFTANQEALKIATRIYNGILSKHYKKGALAHSSLNGALQKGEFLSDHATLLLFATYMHEETRSEEKIVSQLLEKMLKFRKPDGTWIESNNSDFLEVAAQSFDHPGPSSSAVAELALLRAGTILGKERGVIGFGNPLGQDFKSFAAFFSENMHEIKSKEKIEWEKLPMSCIQLPGKGYSDCFDGSCRKFAGKKELLEALEKAQK